MTVMGGEIQRQVQIGNRLTQLSGQTLTAMDMEITLLELVQIPVQMKQDFHSRAMFLAV